MIRKIATAGVAGAIALGGLAAFGVGTAGAANVAVTAGAGSHIKCTAFKSKATLSVALKDPWVKAQHTADPDAGFRAIPDNSSWVLNGPVTVSAPKGKATSCTGVIKGAGGPAAGIAVKDITLALQTDPAHPGPVTPATCANLIAPVDDGNPANDASFKITMSFKSGTKGYTINPTSGTGQKQSQSGLGFLIDGGTLTGSFAGGTAATQANADSKTVAAFLSSSAVTTKTSANGPTKTACQASAKNKKGVWSLSAPKGLQKIGINGGSIELTR